MNIESIQLQRTDVQKLLGVANADAALLYIYLKAGNPMAEAETQLHLSAERIRCAGAILRQLGLYNEEPRTHILAGERPHYSEQDVIDASNTNPSFQSLCEEVHRLLGRPIYTEDRKILLGWVNYLGLSGEVISWLIPYCQEQNRLRGKVKAPTLYSMDKVAYSWAERGIDTWEEAAAMFRAMEMRNSQMRKLLDLLQIRGRSLTAAEERYAEAWIGMGFDDEVISMAYERTCLNTGGLNWAYMNKILQRWHEAGLHTAEEVRIGDRKPATKGASGELGQAEKAAIKRILSEV